MSVKKDCIICGQKNVDHERDLSPVIGFDPEVNTDTVVKCPVCGIYEIHHFFNWDDFQKEEPDDPLLRDWERFQKFAEKKALLRCHVIRSAPNYELEAAKPFKITKNDIRKVFQQDFPTLTEQIDRLILYMGESLRHAGISGLPSLVDPDDSETAELMSASASVDIHNFTAIREGATELGLVQGEVDDYFTLSLKGWQRYDELKKEKRDSKAIFMAMQFDKAQKEFVDDCIKPVIEELGYKLNILSEIYTAENTLDLKLRNTIRESAALICDLTHRNNGAYFEAGFAEGLGKPVIYICEEKTFQKHEENNGIDEGRAHRLHFDVEHQEIYRWKDGVKESIEKFKADLEAKIKASFSLWG
jgi:hypothetical protein